MSDIATTGSSSDIGIGEGALQVADYAVIAVYFLAVLVVGSLMDLLALIRY